MTSKTKTQPSAKAAKDKDKWNIHSPAMNAYWCDRTLCGALDNTRTIVNALQTAYPENNLGILMSLIEEIQVYASRMESALGDFKSSEKLREEYRQMKKELITLYTEKPQLEPERNKRWEF